METVKILAIAPYEGMKNMMETIARQRDDFELDVFVGDLQHGVEIVKTLDLFDYDVIISRGGTAEMIRPLVSIPLLEIALTHYDILSAIRLAQNYSGRFAIVGFPGIADFSRMLCEILEFDIPIYTIHSKQEAQKRVDELKEHGYDMILSDMISTTYAKSIGMHAILITSGSESISATFDQAVSMYRYHATLKRELHYYSSIVKSGGQTILIFGEDGTFLFSNTPDNKIQTLLKLCQPMISSILKDGDQKIFRRIGGKTLILDAKKIAARNELWVSFSITESEWGNKLYRYGIQILNKADTEHQFFNLFYRQSAHKELRQKAEQYSHSKYPVLIIGEPGTGKDKMANLIYNGSSFRNSLYYIIDCKALPAKGWRYLFESTNSPLYGEQNTIYFKSIGQLDCDLQNELFLFIENFAVSPKNRLIFSCVNETEGTNNEALCGYLKNKLGCLSITLPPLRHRIHDIPSLTSLYLNEINATSDKQIGGIEPEGMAMLQTFSWEANLEQFKRVLNELVTITTSSYITAQSVRQVLRGEKRALVPSSNHDINLEQTLDDIIFEVVNQVLVAENMNQTRAAKRLGIGRTTLWRVLNR